MKTKHLMIAILSTAITLTGMAQSPCCKTQTKCAKPTTGYKAKYTNADFYTNGKFNKDVALKAYLDMFKFYGIEYTEFMKKNMFISDFNLGDFENTGMAGIFWTNDAEHNMFGHEIYLLPGQMIAEHAHVATKYPAKHETGLVRYGSGYNFSIGDPTPNPPALPASQKKYITLSHFEPKKVGDMVFLSKLESKHFLFAGPHGLVVTEFGTYHDNAGLRFSNPNVKF